MSGTKATHNLCLLMGSSGSGVSRYVIYCNRCAVQDTCSENMRVYAIGYCRCVGGRLNTQDASVNY